MRQRSRSRRGTAALDYAIIASIVSISIVAGSLLLREALGDTYGAIAVEVEEASGS